MEQSPSPSSIPSESLVFLVFCTIAWFWQQLVGFLWISLGFSLVPGSMNYLCFSLSRLERRRERTVRERMGQTGAVQHSDLKLSVCHNIMLHSSCLGQPLSLSFSFCSLSISKRERERRRTRDNVHTQVPVTNPVKSKENQPIVVKPML